jgi:hypothetical protein
MNRKFVAALSAFCTLGLLAGCSSDRPHDYGQARPPIDELTPGDSGLQSKDVVEATDKLANALVTAPALNASRTQWTLVVTGVDNQTRDHTLDADIFTERLRVNLSKYGHGRINLIENRAKLQDLQSKELDPVAPPDNYGQGPGAQRGPNGVQPDYALYAKFMEMPNRSTSYYFCEFTVTNLHTREQVWTDAYEVKAAR